MKPSRKGIISIILILLASLLGTTTQTGFSFGDELFSALGIPLWSNGQSGFRIPSLFALTLLIIGCLIARREMPTRRIVIIILLLTILSPMVVSTIKPVYFKMQNGLATVEYEYKSSKLEIRNSADYLEVTGLFVLTNYGKDTIKIGIRVPSESGYTQQEIFSQDFTLTEIDNSGEHEKFTLLPGETKYISTFSTVPSKKDFNGYASLNGPNLILFTEDEMRMVGRNL